ncbi:GNAT family acetyltransferase [Glaciihabitans arcticus]|uniref:GNAT family acetyltransferase n=1 Tax=Glaciihabitans arcticus TaxID=2668039 RepID=A0A4Q9GSL6_9MICO|nr:GNAT family acetyltransferase [Glaciihabitans arcticus]TBN58002.1 GNAT family acetyltransferase [Glaciihabitans arcticus]
MTLRPFHPADESAVIDLWVAAGLVRPWNDPRLDVARKLSTQPELFLVIEDEDVIVATAMVGYDGHRGWVYYLAVAEQHRGRGFARQLMAEAERLLIERGCPKIMLMVRADNAAVIGMYEGLGYATESTVVMGKRLIADAAPDAPRPAAE